MTLDPLLERAVPGLVSTIVPVHNRPGLLREAVESVLAQTYRPIEIIIVDDGSTDETGQAAEGLKGAYPDEITVLRRPNGGPGLARETGRQRARGEFIQYLDSDDLLLPRKFELQVTGLRANPSCGVAYGMSRFYVLGDTPADRPLLRTGDEIEAMFPDFLRARCWHTSTPLYRRDILVRAGPWTALRNEEDWEYDCRVASLGVRLHNCGQFVSDSRTHKGGRASQSGSTDPDKLADRAKAHELILDHAKRAGIAPDAPEMQHFARELFLLSRQCGAAGLGAESEQLFHLSRAASLPRRAAAWDFRTYGAVAKLIGWGPAGRVACWTDGLRPR